MVEQVGQRRGALAAMDGLAVVAGVVFLLALTFGSIAVASDHHDPKAIPVSSTSTSSTTTTSSTSTTSTTTTEAPPETTTTIAKASRSQTSPTTAQEATPAPAAEDGDRSIGSSAYCLQGRMANGNGVHDGAVASITLPMGTRWKVVSSDRPSGQVVVGRVFEVEDTGGPRATFDVWMGSCSDALAFGRPVLGLVQV